MPDAPEIEALRREVARLQADVDATGRRLRATHAVARALAEDASVADAMPRILAALASALDAKLAAFWQPDGDALVATTTWCAVPAEGPAWEALCNDKRFESGSGLPGKVWKERGPSWVADIGSSVNLPRHAGLVARGVKSGIGFPIVVAGNVLGVMELFFASTAAPDDSLVEVLRTIGAHLGQFLRQAQATSAAQATARELANERETLTRLDEVAQRIVGQREISSLVQVVSDAATELTGAQFGAFFYQVTDPHSGESAMAAAVTGATRAAFDKLGLSRKQGVFTATFDGKGPVRIADVTRDPRFAKNLPERNLVDPALPMKSYLAVPVITRGGTVLGGLFFGHADASVFGGRQQQIASAIAAHAATAMDNARLHADSQRLIKELEKTNVELDQFAYVASHDLRAPLRGISNLALWIEEDLGSTLPKKVAEQLQLLRGRAARMDKLINGLLELARVGRARQQTERVDVTELLHETIDLASPSASARVLIIGAMPTLIAERVALQQVMLNLITNSLQHAKRKDVIVRITADERADEVEIVVADNGVGIAPEHHERVWQMFQTLASRDQVESTGIGLAIVRKQVEAAGGRAWIDAAVRDGATVRFTWPKRIR
jgi:signal transduction histidine kinase